MQERKKNTNVLNILKSNSFTIILLTIMAIALVFASSYTETTVKDVPNLNLQFAILLTVVGIFSGLLGGWIGTGGCSIMLPVLHFWLGFRAPIAIGTTLFAVIFTSLSGGYGHLRRKNLDKRVALWTGLAGIIGVLIGSWLFTYLSTASNLLAMIIGIVFLWPSARMIWEGIKSYKKAQVKKDVEGKTINGSPIALAIFGIVIGILTGIVGLGGGYALVPGLIYLFNAPVYLAMGTSLAIMIPLATVGGVIKLLQGFVHLPAGLLLGIGTVIGAQIGAATIKKIKPHILKLIFGLYFLYVSLKFITSYFGIYIW